jgi:enoyl-CoA hydratase
MTDLAEQSTLVTLDEAVVLIDCKDGLEWTTLNRPRVINAVYAAIRTGPTHRVEQRDSDASLCDRSSRRSRRRFLRWRRHQKQRRSDALPQRRDSLAAPSWVQALGRVCKVTSTSTQCFCFGCGLELELACDMRVASEDAIFSLVEINRGLIPGDGEPSGLLVSPAQVGSTI